MKNIELKKNIYLLLSNIFFFIGHVKIGDVVSVTRIGEGPEFPGRPERRGPVEEEKTSPYLQHVSAIAAMTGLPESEVTKTSKVALEAFQPNQPIQLSREEPYFVVSEVTKEHPVDIVWLSGDFLGKAESAISSKFIWQRQERQPSDCLTATFLMRFPNK